MTRPLAGAVDYFPLDQPLQLRRSILMFSELSQGASTDVSLRSFSLPVLSLYTLGPTRDIRAPIELVGA